MLNSFLLVRHAKPTIDENIPAYRWNLSSEGEAAALALSTRLGCFDVGSIISSPEQKALSTAEPTARLFGLQITIDERVAEHHRRHTGYLASESFRSSVAAFFRSPDLLVFGEETASEALGRFAQAVSDHRQNANGKDTIIFTHGTVMSLFLARRYGLDAYEIWQGLSMPCAFDISSPTLANL